MILKIWFLTSIYKIKEMIFLWASSWISGSRSFFLYPVFDFFGNPLMYCRVFTTADHCLYETLHTLSELTNILYLLALVILTLFSLVDTITEGSWHLLFIYYWLTHYLFLLLLAQLHRLDTTAHEQIAMEVGAGWKLDICHFQQGV